VLVEGSSEKALLTRWLPRFLPRHTFTIIQHRGKGRLPVQPEARPDVRREGLLDQLPAKLRAYGRALDPSTDRVLVLVDLDDDSCLDLKRRLLEALENCEPKPVMLFRIAIEETEVSVIWRRFAVRLLTQSREGCGIMYRTVFAGRGNCSNELSMQREKTSRPGLRGWDLTWESLGRVGARIDRRRSGSSAAGFSS
jgi:hypothetical protein